MPAILQALSNDFYPGALLLVQPIRSGKSDIPRTASVIANGVSTVIEPTLTLSADQVSKFDVTSKEHVSLACSCQLESRKKR